MMPRLPKNNSIYFNVGVFIAIVLVGFALYFIPLQNKFFYFDDHVAIENNAAIRKIDIPRIFNAFNTRFLVGLSFALNYRWCDLHLAGYRLINLLIHCLNAFLVYLLVKSTLYLCSERKLILFGKLEWPAFFASMLFLCHPIQSEPVNFITERFVLMASFFYLLTLWLYIQYRCRLQKRYLMGSLISALAAMFCKEFVVTLPFMLVLYEFYFLESVNATIWIRCRRLIPFFVIILIVPILLLRTPPQAIWVANIADSNIVQTSNMQKVERHIDITRARGAIDRQQYFFTELHVLCTYIRQLFLPMIQYIDFDYPVSSNMDKKTAVCGVFLLCLLALAVAIHKSYRLVSFGILWFFIALSVESSFIPIGNVIVEYRLYLASVGFVILVMSLIYGRQADQKKLNMIAAIILIGFSILTYQRNQFWKDDMTIWEDLFYKRGIVYTKEGHLIQAMSYLYKAMVCNNLGFIYAKEGNFAQAMADYNKAIEINPQYAIAYNNRAVAYYHLKEYDQAWADIRKAEELGIMNPEFINALKQASGGEKRTMPQGSAL